MIDFSNKQKVHFLFLLLLSLNYIFPLLIFGKITLFYHDTLDSEIVFNSALGKFFNGDQNAIKYFLNEEIQVEFLRRAMQPFSIFYYFFNPELAYWTVDILVKITSYFSFFILAKKINKEVFLSALTACLFASINERTVEGFGFAIIPYLIYLILFKENLKIKHYLIIIFFGLNTDLVKCLTAFPAIIIFSFILREKNNNKYLSNLLKIISIFGIFIIISNLNLIYTQFKYGPILQRLDFFYEPVPFIKNIYLYFVELLSIPDSYSWTLFKKFPQFIIFTFVVLSTLIIKEKNSLKILIFILILFFIPFLLRMEFVTTLRNASNGLFKTFHFEYITWITPTFFLILLSFNLKKLLNFKKYLNFLILLVIVFFQINSSLVPLAKKINTKNEYRNIYTFDGYYMYEDYEKIKKIIGKQKVISVGYDPMIPIMSNIFVIDGYHNIYPLSYKSKFRKIIEKELEKDENLKKYYDDWGNRLYAFVVDEKNIDLNFLKAKKIGANYIISKYEINSTNVRLVEGSFKNKIYLYKIN